MLLKYDLWNRKKVTKKNQQVKQVLKYVWNVFLMFQFIHCIIDAFNLYSKQFDAFSRQKRWKTENMLKNGLGYPIRFWNIISGGVLIRSGGLEKNQKINKRPPPCIKHPRVNTYMIPEGLRFNVLIREDVKV